MRYKSSKKFLGVRKIKDGVFEINFQLPNKGPRIFKRIKAASMYEAYQEKSRLIQQTVISKDEIRAGKRNIAFDALKEQFIRDLKGDNLRKKTISRALNTYNTFFFVFLPDKYPEIQNVNVITTDVFNEYKNFVVNDQGRKKGWRSELGTLKGVFSRLVRLGYCKKEVSEYLSEFKKPFQMQKKYKELTKTDKQKLLAAIKQHRLEYYGVTYMLIRLGWRIEEVLSVKKENVKFRGLNPVLIRLDPEVRKNKKEFVLETIDDDLASVIKQFSFRQKGYIWLFPNSLGNKISSNHFREYLASVSQRTIKKRVTPHDFRHSLITEAGLKNMPIRDVMAITGHTDINVLIKYYSHSTEEGRTKVLKMSSV